MIRIGLLGAAWITPMAVLEPSKLISEVEVTAVAARDPERARNYASEHGIEHVEDSYQALLARPDLDLIYIALPASFHEEWAGAALAAGKHVLCEKPLVMNAKEARNLAQISQASNKLLIEAFHYRHHPYFKRILEIVNRGELGRIRSLVGRLHVPVPSRKGQIRHEPSLGGGALMDLGCYPLHMIRTILAEEPLVNCAKAKIGATGVDLSFTAELSFSDGVTGLIDCAMPETGELFGELIIEGERGKLTASKPILPHLGGILHIETPLGERDEAAGSRSTFFYQLEAVAEAISEHKPREPSMTDSIANADGLDAIRATWQQ